MAAIRLDEDKDSVENTLQLVLLDTPNISTTNRSIHSLDPLASSSWDDVRPHSLNSLCNFFSFLLTLYVRIILPCMEVTFEGVPPSFSFRSICLPL